MNIAYKLFAWKFNIAKRLQGYKKARSLFS